MKKVTKTEKNEELQELKPLVKAVYKAILKSLRSKKRKDQTDEIIDDILDPNYIAQVDPDELPNKKDKVLYKKDDKSLKSREKGVTKLKRMCKKVKNNKVCKDEPIPGLYQN